MCTGFYFKARKNPKVYFVQFGPLSPEKNYLCQGKNFVLSEIFPEGFGRKTCRQHVNGKKLSKLWFVIMQ